MAESIKTIGIVLKSSKHTVDAARILDIFSPEKGRFSAVIRGVEKPKAKLAVASQPFCLGEFILAEKSGFYTVTDCYVHDSFFELAYNLDAYVLGSSMLEMTSKLVMVGESNFELFSLLLKSLKAIVYQNAEPTAVTIKYIIEILNASGFGFNVENCCLCGKPLKNERRVGVIYEGDGVLCESHIKGQQCVELSSSEWGVLKNIGGADIEELSRMKFSSRESLTSILKLMLKQFYFRTGEKLLSLDKYF